jgi:hypothetical protein
MVNYTSCGAHIHDTFRYSLWRTWGIGPTLLWIMLNPSTANGEQDDQTISTIVAISMALGYGGLVVVNAYAYRATDPKVLRAADYPVGPLNDTLIQWQARSADDIVCAWGANIPPARATAIRTMLCDFPLLRLDSGLTKGGQPRHPLYHSHDTKLVLL